MSDGVDCPHVAAWMRTPPRISGPVGEDALGKVCKALTEMGVTCVRAGQATAFRAALVKMLASVESAPALDLSETEVFGTSQRLREAFYLEIMSYRRAAQADVDMGALRA